MAITAARIEPNGWVLRLTLTGGLSSAVVGGFSLGNDTTAGASATTAATQYATNFSAYDPALTVPDRTWTGAAPLTLTVTSAGFAQSAGQAVAATPTRTLYGTKVLRKVVNATAAGVRDAKNPDEVDNGDGTITVRIALHQQVYAGDSGLSLAATAGWRTGLGAQTIAVTNTSTVPAPAPIVRWSDVPYQLQAGSFWLEVVAASHHPSGLSPVAAVKFTVTDGTTVKTFWATSLTNSPAFNPTPGSGGGTLVAPRVYAVQVDPTTATALTQGLLRCDFIAYPWIGPAQTSDPAGTRSMAALGTAAVATSAFVPFVVAYNPGNAWITPRFVDVDEVNGTATVASVTVGTSAAAAAAGTPAISVNVALMAAYTLNVTVAAANGQSAITRSVDGLTLTLRKANGTTTGIANGSGSTSVTSGIATGATFVTVRGDPGDATQRACIWRSPGTASSGSRITKLRVSALSVEAQTNSVMATATGAVWLDNAEVRGVSGQSTATGAPFNTVGNLLWATNGRYWQHGTRLGFVSSSTAVLVRSMSVERELSAPVVLGSARLPTAIVGTAGFSTTITGVTDIGWALERLAIGNDLRYLNSAPMGINSVQLAVGSVPPAYTLGGTAYPAYARTACINNLGEAYGTSQTLWASIGENTLMDFCEVIVEGNTLTGDRTNCPYGSGADVTLALTDAATPRMRTFRFANNVTMKNASKHDRYNDGGILGGTPTTNGIAGTPSAFAAGKRTWGRLGATLGAALTRNWSVAVGDELTVAGPPTRIYRCSTAGTTAASGGPTGTGSGIADGTAAWDYIGAETRTHGFRPSSTGMWASHYGVGYEGNIDFQQTGDVSYDPEFFFEFYGIGSQQLSQAGVTGTTDPFTDDHSGTSNALTMQSGSQKNGGGNYRPLATGGGTYILGRGRNANVDTGLVGTARGATFAAGAVQPLGATVTALLPASGREASAAASPTLLWTALLGPAPGTLATRASVGATGIALAVTAAASRLPTRAAASGAAWAGVLAPAGAVQATRAAAATAGWRGLLTPASTLSKSRAAASLAGWRTQLAAAPAAEAQAAGSPGVGWQASLSVDGAAMGMSAAAPLFTLSPLALTVAGGRIALVDTRLLPPLTPAAPPERTLVVAADCRTLFIA